MSSNISSLGRILAVATPPLYVSLMMFTGAPDWMQPITN